MDDSVIRTSPGGQSKQLSATTAPASSRSVYYALDATPRVVFELRQSIQSLRQRAPSLPVYVVTAGELPANDRAFLDAFDVTTIASRIERGTSPTFLKWRALEAIPLQGDLLYLDTDTLVFENPALLFDASGPEDFHARLEIGCNADEAAYPFLFNTRIFTKSRIDHWLFRRIVELRRGHELPIFNTGIMLFRNGFARQVGNRWKDFLRLDRQFRRKQLPYPCWNAHILEEIVAPIVLGSIGAFTWKPLPPEHCPFYLEYRVRDVQGHGIILHAWSAYYDCCLFEFMGKDPALSYRSLRSSSTSGGSSVSTQLSARWLLLGSMWVRLPRRWQELWLRMGPTQLPREPVYEDRLSY